MRKDYILETCQKWIREGEGSHSSAHVSRLKNLTQELKQLLDANQSITSQPLY